LWPLAAPEELQVSGRGQEGVSCTKQVGDSVTYYALSTFFDCIIMKSLHINQLQDHFLLGLQSPLLLPAVNFHVILVAAYKLFTHTEMRFIFGHDFSSGAVFGVIFN